MRMHHGRHVGPHLVNGEVHRDLGGSLARAIDLVAFQIADDDVGGSHHALADAGAGAQNAAVVQAHTDVAIVGRDPSFLIDQLADVEDVLAMLLLRLGHPDFQL
jgi:hypothetical protein